LRVKLESPEAPAAAPKGRGRGRSAAGRRVVPAILGVLPLVLAAGLLLPAAAATPAGGAVPAVFRDVAGLPGRALAAALDAVACARTRGLAGRDGVLTLIDYSLPSTEPRLWVLDLAHGRVLFHELVAHGAGSGDNYATRFSNTAESRQSSLGLFLTGGTYEGGNGYSLRLSGLDPGVNDRAAERNIVIHGAWYVSADHAQRYGRLGRSWGCPALPEASAHAVIDVIKDGTFVFAYAGGDASSQVSRVALPAACAVAPVAASPAPFTAGTHY
jgi:hypothetical protein